MAVLEGELLPKPYATGRR